MRKDVKLYNVLFPIWMLVLFPLTWLIVLPGNFIIDFTVVAVTMKFLKLPDIIKTTKTVILRVWIMGFVADFIGTAGMLLSNFLDSWVNTDFTYELMFAVNYNPFEIIWGFLWVTVCVVITAVLIYVFNYKWCLKNADFDEAQRKKIALSLAIFTAPYLFYLPSMLFYY